MQLDLDNVEGQGGDYSVTVQAQGPAAIASGAAQTLRSYTNGAPSAGPVSIAGFGPLLGPDVPLTVAGYGDGAPGPSVVLAALVVFPRQLTPAEIASLPAELGLAG